MASIISNMFVLAVCICCLPGLSIAGQYKVVKIYDGNTIKVSGQGKEIPIRLVGIDSPEKGQPYFDASRELLRNAILHKRIDIISHGVDPYKRLLAEAFLGGENINIEILRAGLAEVYRGELPADLDLRPYLRAEKDAREAMRGIWSLGRRYVSPLKWRRMRRLYRYRSQQQESFPESPPF